MVSLICIGGEVCNGCGVCSIKNHLETNYSDDDFDSILNSDTMLELLVREIIFDESEVVSTLTYLKSLRDVLEEPNAEDGIENSFHQDEIIELKNTSIQQPKLSKIRYVATDYNTKVKQMDMIDSFFEQLNLSSKGVSKTTFLKSISKDNRRGRKDFDDIIRTTLREGVLVKVGRQYYLRNNIITQENNFHRKVYHIIYDNEPISSSGILTQLNYRNSKGRRKLLQILKLMSEENLIEYSSNKWSVTR
tara:strand:+ start:1207 stop:1950 length:744 start_codon:yes stop_codon:yes gene_type:complete